MMKYCPYAVVRRVQHVEQVNGQDDSGQVCDTITDFIPLPCRPQTCGAYRDGACHYNG